MKNLTKSIIVVSLLSSVAFAAPTAQEKFNNADINNNGELTSKEFYNDQARKMESKVKEGRALKGASTAPQFDNVDINSDGKITYKEFNTFHTYRQKEMQKIKQQRRNTGQRGSGQGRKNGNGMR